MNTCVAPEIVEAYEAWWAGKNTEPLIYYSYTDKSLLQQKREASNRLSQKGVIQMDLSEAVVRVLETGSWDYVEGALDHIEAHLDVTGYALQGFPAHWVNFGPGSLAANITDYAKFGNGTVWFELERDQYSYERIIGLDDRIRRSYAEISSETVKRTAQRLGGKTVLSQVDIGGPYDILASLRGSQNLLMDFFDQPPDLIDKACRKIESIWCTYEKEYDGLIACANNGLRTTWITVLSEKPWYSLQCDLSAMISPDTFEQLIKPSIQRQAALYERSIYHHDGDGQIAHTGFFADIEQVTAMQWVPIPPLKINDECWDDLYRQYIDIGKKVVLRSWPVEDTDGVKRLFSKLPKEAFWFSIHGPDEKSAYDFIRALGIQENRK